MGNSQGRDNVKKRAARRKKNDRLAAAKDNGKKIAVAKKDSRKTAKKSVGSIG
jgi:hypothetical protein